MPNKNSKFVYVTYIASTPEQVFNSLTDGELIKDYWGRHNNVSDWKVGSRWEHRDYDDPKLVDIVGTVLENDPPRRLVLSWALPSEAGQPDKTSRVTFEVKMFFDSARLTMSHEELAPDSEMLQGITQGWPAVLSGLKTLLESGKPMPMMTRRWEGPPPA